MKDRIFYGLAGEGLGHASRTLAVIDHLQNYEVHLFTFGKAYEFLKEMNYPYLHQINGIMFPYKNNKIDYPQLTYDVIDFYFNDLKKNILYISNLAVNLNPILYISDFEPSIPRVAKKYNQKLISIDNQHRFAYIDLIELPTFLRIYGWFCGLAAKCLVPYPDQTIISTFHFDYIKAKRKNVYLTNGLFRNNITEQIVSEGDYLLVYLRPCVSKLFLKAINELTCEVRIYGAGDEQLISKPNFKFYPLSSEFVKDLAGCNRLLTTAGNQLISEARYFGKFCLLVPEPGQYEQSINAFYAEKINVGIHCKKLTSEVVNNFMKMDLPKKNEADNGVEKVIQIIKDDLHGN